MENEFIVPSRKQPVFRVTRAILKLFYRKPKIICLADEVPDKGIFLANHSAKSGPMSLTLYFPKFCVKWGAHQMLGNYASRKAYLRDVYYMQKRGYGKFKSSFFASIEALFSIFFYRGMKIVPTYPDGRLAKTISNCIKVLEDNKGVMIYPENSNSGYLEVMTEFFPGFVSLANRYYKIHNEDVPMFPVYLHLKKRILVIGKPVYLQDLVKEGMDREQIAEVMKNQVNDLFFNYVNNEE